MKITMNKLIHFIVRHLSLLFLSSFLFLFISRTFFPVINKYALSLFSLTLLLLIGPPLILAIAPAAKKYYDKKLSASLWAIFALGFASLLLYYLQTDFALGKMVLNPDYADQREWLEKIKLFCQVSYMISLAAATIYAGIFQASLKAIVEDTQRSSFLQSAAIGIGLLLSFLIALNSESFFIIS